MIAVLFRLIRLRVPTPPIAFIHEHFRQAVLANMRGASQPPMLSFDPEDDEQNMSVFESGDGKLWFETASAGQIDPRTR